jgi:dCMP deaminase
MPSQNKWDEHWMRIAFSTAKLSKDKSTKVGSVIVNNDNTRISTGYNGFVKGIDETEEKWERPRKYLYVRHAEENAIIFCPFERSGATLYCTHQPCHRCIGLIAQANIRRVLYCLPYNNLEHKDIWDEHVKLFDEVRQFSIDL